MFYKQDPMARYINGAFKMIVFKVLFSDNSKLGKLYFDAFKDRIPDPFIALVAAGVSVAFNTSHLYSAYHSIVVPKLSRRIRRRWVSFDH